MGKGADGEVEVDRADHGGRPRGRARNVEQWKKKEQKENKKSPSKLRQAETAETAQTAQTAAPSRHGGAGSRESRNAAGETKGRRAHVSDEALDIVDDSL